MRDIAFERVVQDRRPIRRTANSGSTIRRARRIRDVDKVKRVFGDVTAFEDY